MGYTIHDDTIPLLGKITFFFIGVASLVGWNAILTGLDFFTSKFPDYDYSFYISIPMFVGNNLVNLFIHILSKYLSLKLRIIIGLMGQILTLILIPIQAKFMEGTASGFYISLLLVFFDGCCISMQQSSSVAFAAVCPYQALNIFFTGTGMGGIIICLVRCIMLGSIGAEGEDSIFLGTLVYFIIAAVLLFAAIFLFLAFYKSPYCRMQLNKSKLKSFARTDNIVDQIVAGPLQNLSQQDLLDENTLLATKSGKEPLIKEEEGDKTYDGNINGENPLSLIIEDQKSVSFIFKVFKKIQPFPLLVFLIYVQTFMLFPGVALKRQLSSLKNPAWSATIMILTFNIGDTIGKYLGNFRFYNKINTTIFVLFRFIFFASYICIVVTDADVITDDWFMVINMLVFAIMNGLGTCAAMVLAPEVAQKNEKETAGFIMNNGLYMGIMIGSFMALTFKNLGK